MNDECDNTLAQTARQLNKNVSPTRDLWPGIAAAIEKPARRRHAARPRPVFAQAAAVVLLIGASSSVTYFAMKNQQPQLIVTPADMIFEEVSFTSRYTLGPGFQDARDSLVTELNVEFEKLPQETRATVLANLNAIRGAIIETNAALEEDPDNAVLQGRLMRAYGDELALLRRVGDLSRNVTVRNDI